LYGFVLKIITVASLDFVYALTIYNSVGFQVYSVLTRCIHALKIWPNNFLSEVTAYRRDLYFWTQGSDRGHFGDFYYQQGNSLVGV
jgi:hypothetical protein